MLKIFIRPPPSVRIRVSSSCTKLTVMVITQIIFYVMVNPPACESTSIKTLILLLKINYCCYTWIYNYNKNNNNNINNDDAHCFFFLLRWKITVLLVVTVSLVECYALFISDLAQIWVKCEFCSHLFCGLINVLSTSESKDHYREWSFICFMFEADVWGSG